MFEGINAADVARRVKVKKRPPACFPVPQFYASCPVGANTSGVWQPFHMIISRDIDPMLRVHESLSDDLIPVYLAHSHIPFSSHSQ